MPASAVLIGHSSGSAALACGGMDFGPILGGYPGRGLMIGAVGPGDHRWVYFVTGRSLSSRQRRLLVDDDALTIAPTDDIAVRDDLRHYVCARRIDGQLVVGNGDHVDVIAAGIGRGESLAVVLEQVDPEPDPPILTPRIAIVVNERPSVLAVHRGNAGVIRRVLPVSSTPGTATLVTTYDGDLEQPVGSAPVRQMEGVGDVGSVLERIWTALDPDLRVLALSGDGSSIRHLEVRP